MMNFPVRYGDGWGMMGNSYWGVMGGYGPNVYLVLHVITWVLVIAILVALFRWLWKKGK